MVAFAASMIGLLSSSLVMHSRLPVAQPSLAARSQVVCSAGVEGKIKAAVDGSKVMVFSKSWCPFCMKTKALFESLDVPYSAMELDELDDGVEIQEELLKMTDQRTVPSVWIGGKHLGGNDGAPAPQHGSNYPPEPLPCPQPDPTSLPPRVMQTLSVPRPRASCRRCWASRRHSYGDG